MFFCSLSPVSQAIILSEPCRQKKNNQDKDRLLETSVTASLNIYYIKNKDKREWSSIYHKTHSLKVHLQTLPKTTLLQFLYFTDFSPSCEHKPPSVPTELKGGSSRLHCGKAGCALSLLLPWAPRWFPWRHLEHACTNGGLKHWYRKWACCLDGLVGRSSPETWIS